MDKIKVIRTLEYYGHRDTIEEILKRSWVKGTKFITGGHIKEVSVEEAKDA